MKLFGLKLQFHKTLALYAIMFKLGTTFCEYENILNTICTENQI